MIRKARPADIPALVELERRAFRGVYAAHRFEERQFHAWLDRRNTWLRVVDLDGVVAGYALGRFGTGARRLSARLESIAVDPGRARRGVGQALLTAFLRQARRLGRTRITTEVWVRNHAAIALFSRTGFKVRRRLADYYGPSRDALRMARVEKDG